MDVISSRLVRFEHEGEKRVSYFYYEFAGDSSEEKPTRRITDGSIFTETDTGDVYMFNAKTSAWVKMFGLKS